jgi:hypothetical protein
MKNRTLQLAGVLALIAVVGKFYAVPAIAQVRAALVQNRDEPARNFYSVESFCQTPTFNYCEVDFPAVPAGKRLIIQHVSALNSMPAANTIGDSDLRIKGSGSIKAFLPVVAPPTGSNYITNAAVLASFEAGEQPSYLVFSSSPTFTTVAVLSGYMIDIP